MRYYYRRWALQSSTSIEDERIFAYERILGGPKLLLICNLQEEAGVYCKTKWGTVLAFLPIMNHINPPYDAAIYGNNCGSLWEE